MTLHFTSYNLEADVVPIFLIHTSPLDHTYLLNSLELLNHKKPIVFIDLPGHGKSSLGEDDELMLTKVSESIDNVREQLGFQKISILGHGIGGFFV